MGVSRCRELKPRFGFSDKTIDVSYFKGTVKMTSLRVYPMRWHPREEDMRARLIARGRRWQDLDISKRGKILYYLMLAGHISYCLQDLILLVLATESDSAGSDIFLHTMSCRSEASLSDRVRPVSGRIDLVSRSMHGTYLSVPVHDTYNFDRAVGSC